MLSLVMLIMTLTAVEVNTLVYYSFVEIRIFDADLGLEIRILTPSRVEMIVKRSTLCLETTTNR